MMIRQMEFLLFLSTPSARRATAGGGKGALVQTEFLSTPSARRATSPWAIRPARNPYFYPRPPRGGRRNAKYTSDTVLGISIHALREEGDIRGED